MRRKAAGLLVLTLILINGGFAASKANVHQKPGVAFKVLYNFTNGKDGCCILGGPALDHEGNLYGIAYSGNGLSGDGDLFKLIRTPRGYTLRVIQAFSRAKGRECYSTPTIDTSGNLFGVCFGGGSTDNGTLWEYSRSRTFTVLHNFTGPGDGQSPEDSVALDGTGNIYGTAATWGPGGSGTLWEYSLSSGTFTLLHSFADGNDGASLPAGPRIDKTGLIWGTTEFGPNCYACGSGTVWNYDPLSETFSTIQDFGSTDVAEPLTRLAFGRKGNAFGTAGGSPCGQIYELQKNNDYVPVLIYQFPDRGPDGCAPNGQVAGGAGYILGTTTFGGDFGCGTVYQLRKRKGSWRETILHSFNCNDGYQPASGLATDHKGNWFGTAAYGGKYGWGTIFEISGGP